MTLSREEMQKRKIRPISSCDDDRPPTGVYEVRVVHWLLAQWTHRARRTRSIIHRRRNRTGLGRCLQNVYILIRPARGGGGCCYSSDDRRRAVLQCIVFVFVFFSLLILRVPTGATVSSRRGFSSAHVSERQKKKNLFRSSVLVTLDNRIDCVTRVITQ